MGKELKIRWFRPEPSPVVPAARDGPIDVKKALKAEYDRKYRIRNRDMLKAKKHAYFKKTYDPVQAAVARKKRMPFHVEYCRRPAYKAKKQSYDKRHRAQQQYGEFWESALLIEQIESHYSQQEVRQINNLHNKAQNRKRAHGNSKN
ncbi:MAG: hypothetical protein JWP57_2040 [Spirosoma sp.]|nr:hypothetical protein [Spirosoma sp.]